MPGFDRGRAGSSRAFIASRSRVPSRSASRIGVRLTPYCSASCSWRSIAPNRSASATSGDYSSYSIADATGVNKGDDIRVAVRQHQNWKAGRDVPQQRGQGRHVEDVAHLARDPNGPGIDRRRVDRAVQPDRSDVVPFACRDAQVRDLAVGVTDVSPCASARPSA